MVMGQFLAFENPSNRAYNPLKKYFNFDKTWIYPLTILMFGVNPWINWKNYTPFKEQNMGKCNVIL